MRQKETTGAPIRSDPKLGKRLRMATFVEGGDRKDLCRRDRALTSPPVDANLEHPVTPTSPGAGPRGRGDDGGQVDQPARVARFVVVPTEDLDQFPVGHGELRVEDT